MGTAHAFVLPRFAPVLIQLGLLLSASPCPVWAQSYFEVPLPGSFQSGIGMICGWACSASRVDIVVDDTTTLQTAYGTSRDDIRAVCGDDNNGFGFQINWNNLGDGTHTVRVLADGVQFGQTISGSPFSFHNVHL